MISDAAGNVLATFPADGWDIGWSPDSTRVAVWDTLFETVGVYGVDGTRQAQITMPSGWQPPAITTRRGCGTGRWRSTPWSSRSTVARRGRSTRHDKPEWRDGLPRHDRPCAWTRPMDCTLRPSQVVR